MRVDELLRKLLPLLVAGAAACVIGTVAACLVGSQAHGIEWMLRRLDLRREQDFAAWFESFLFLSAALSFAARPLSGGMGRPRLSRVRWLLIAAITFFSADEMLQIHERIGTAFERHGGWMDDIPLEGTGISWVVLYAIPLLVGAAYLAIRIGSIRDAFQGRATTAFVALVLGAAAVLLLETVEGWFMMTGRDKGLLQALEEGTEVTALLVAIRANIGASREDP